MRYAVIVVYIDFFQSDLATRYCLSTFCNNSREATLPLRKLARMNYIG